ncbi:hypothetical protein AVEN_157929-1 [Araneus ventricosus]|uniref:Uncharacterized protein n=1 Tax=Araneus ventricosus TaxID=182803 RepID=A0A4Y2HAX5_ARAVE|nr:hypothetical protein AVEN_157929-1 [Araneus ventricosus]
MNICKSVRFVPGLYRTSCQTSKSNTGWKPLEISSTRVTGIRSSWKQSLQGMSRGATTTIRRPSDSPWNGHRRSPPKKCRLTKSSIKKLVIAFFDSKGLIHHEFVHAGTTVNAESYEGVRDSNGCCNASGGFGHNCTIVDSGNCSTTTPVRTLLSA